MALGAAAARLSARFPWRYPLLFLFFLVLIRFGYVSSWHPPDAAGYMAYLPAVVAEGTLDFRGPYKTLRMRPSYFASTRTGYVENLWPSGSAFLRLPFYLALYGEFALEGRDRSDPASPWFVAAMNYGSAVLAILAAALSALSLRRVLDLPASSAVAAAALAFFGTPLFYYALVLGDFSHAAAAFAVALLLTVWLGCWTRSEPVSSWDWLALGILTGLCACVRTQDGLFGLAPFILLLRRGRASPGAITAGASLLALGFFIGMAPELLCWKALYGSFVAAPQAFNLSSPGFWPWAVLASPYHGLFSWTPLCLAGVFGLAAFPKERRAAAAALGGIFLLCWLVIARSWWWGGFSFGERYFTSCFWIVALGTGVLLRRHPRAGLCFGLLCAAWTVGLGISSAVGAVDLEAPCSWSNLFEAVRVGWTVYPALAARALVRPPADLLPAAALAAAACACAASLAWFFSAPAPRTRALAAALGAGLAGYCGLIARAWARGPRPVAGTSASTVEALQTLIQGLNWRELAAYDRGEGRLAEAAAADAKAEAIAQGLARGGFGGTRQSPEPVH